MTPDDYFDLRETQSDDLRQQGLYRRLPELIAHAKAHAPWYGKSLADSDASAINSPAALAKLPILHKAELIGLQGEVPPFGGLSTETYGSLLRVFASPGPIYEPEGSASDYWNAARALFAAGFRRGDLLHNSFSYHMTPGAWLIDSGARALGCTVFPGGVGQTEQQLAALAQLGAHGYAGTPSFLRILLEKAEAANLALPTLKKALVSGEAFLASQRDWLDERGVAAYQAYATADLGVIAYETAAREGLVINEDLIVEIVRPGSLEPLPVGEVGEVVVTRFNTVYPLIRFATGDLSALLPGVSPCGRTAQRLKGWLGRADQTAKVKGMFVHPEQIAALVKKSPDIVKARLTLSNPEGRDQMCLLVECHRAEDDRDFAEMVRTWLREVTKLGGDVRLVAPGELANDGKVIDDRREFG